MSHIYLTAKSSTEDFTSDDVTFSGVLVCVTAAAIGMCVVVILLLIVVRLYVQRASSRRRNKCPVTYCSATINGQHLFPLPIDSQWELDPAK
jgi:hypothetical protein